jgi:iron complex transport system ATP-binding protein
MNGSLTATGVGYSIGSAVLVDGVDLHLVPGEVLGVVGPNGAGKSTLLRLLSGELTPTTGDVHLDGRPLQAIKARELALRRAAYSQDSVLQFAFTALEVVLMGRFAHDTSPAEDLAAAQRAMADTDIVHLGARTYPTLSGGERARVGLARVLAQDTTVVLLDEPTAALDLGHQESVMQVLRSLADRGVAVATILHDLNLAARYADRVALMSHGRVVEAGTTRGVLRSELLSTVYAHPVVVVPHPHDDCPLILPERIGPGGES